MDWPHWPDPDPSYFTPLVVVPHELPWTVADVVDSSNSCRCCKETRRSMLFCWQTTFWASTKKPGFSLVRSLHRVPIKWPFVFFANIFSRDVSISYDFCRNLCHLSFNTTTFSWLATPKSTWTHWPSEIQRCKIMAENCSWILVGQDS